MTSNISTTQADTCVHGLRTATSTLMLSVDVNNQLIACNSQSELDKFKAKLKSRFEYSDGRPAS
jgi:hypothetical protein